MHRPASSTKAPRPTSGMPGSWRYWMPLYKGRSDRPRRDSRRRDRRRSSSGTSTCPMRLAAVEHIEDHARVVRAAGRAPDQSHRGRSFRRNGRIESSESYRRMEKPSPSLSGAVGNVGQGALVFGQRERHGESVRGLIVERAVDVPGDGSRAARAPERTTFLADDDARPTRSRWAGKRYRSWFESDRCGNRNRSSVKDASRFRE